MLAACGPHQSYTAKAFFSGDKLAAIWEMCNPKLVTVSDDRQGHTNAL
jgi:hypothetical protein